MRSNNKWGTFRSMGLACLTHRPVSFALPTLRPEWLALRTVTVLLPEVAQRCKNISAEEWMLLRVNTIIYAELSRLDTGVA